MTTTTTKTPSKLDTLEKLLRRKNGASIAEMVKATGWQHHSVRYDDGGFSGGTMERPGLARLLADIEANRVDIVVVYKIDRLTRRSPTSPASSRSSRRPIAASCR